MKKYNRSRDYNRLAGGLLAVAMTFGANSASAGFIAYTDRASFSAALAMASLPAANENYDSYAPGVIANNSILGAFNYSFDPAVVGPSVASDGTGGMALGGNPYDVFVGGDSVTLKTANALPMFAFGADFFYAPSFDSVPADTFRLRIGDGVNAGNFIDNGILSADGGSFFLGIIADLSSGFTGIDLLSLAHLDSNGDPLLTPAYQIDNLIYSGSSRGVGVDTAVPEPAAYLLLLSGMLILGYTRRNQLINQ